MDKTHFSLENVILNFKILREQSNFVDPGPQLIAKVSKQNIQTVNWICVTIDFDLIDNGWDIFNAVSCLAGFHNSFKNAYLDL